MPELIHGTKWLVINQVNEKTVEIDITGSIGGDFWGDSTNSVDTKEKMRAELKAISEINATKIIVNISSPGGDVDHGLAIHDMLAQHKAEKEVRITGMTASIATVIAMSGNVRKMSDNALMLPHHAMAITLGNINEHSATADMLKKVDDRLFSIYVKRGADEEKIKEIIDFDNGNGKWIDAGEAKAIGLIDEITEPMKAAAVWDKELFAKFKYPELPINKNNMTDNDVKTFGEKLDSIINKFEKFFTKKQELTDKSGSKMTLEKESGDPAVGDKAGPDGSFAMESGKTIVVASGKITEIKDTVVGKSELETANARIAELEAELATAKAAKVEADRVKSEAEAMKVAAEAMKTEAVALKTELQNLKNTWTPDARNHGGGAVDGKDKVKAILKKANKKTNENDDE